MRQERRRERSIQVLLSDAGVESVSVVGDAIAGAKGMCDVGDTRAKDDTEVGHRRQVVGGAVGLGEYFDVFVR